MSKKQRRIKNYYYPITEPLTGKTATTEQVTHNLGNYISPVQLQRIRQDVITWREGIMEAEAAYYPHRVRMQRLFQDTILNGHVDACIKRRKNMVLLKEFKLCNDAGVENDEVTKLFKSQWFERFVNYALDAELFGYSLITLGDIENDGFPEISVIKRHNVSPDRLNVTSYVYSLDGAHFMEDPYKLWHVWIPTPTELGVSQCGYGLLYKVGLYEIFCRNVLGFNGDYVELFSQPFRVGYTGKTKEDERAAFEGALRDMGSSGYALLDLMGDKIEFIESQNSGTGWQGYENLEKRCEAKISKMILGHADALDSVAGKLGKEESVAEALRDVETQGVKFVEPIINNQLLPRMREMGFNIPLDIHFEYKNDQEEEEFRKREDESNKRTADIAQTLQLAGLQMSAEYFTERTGIPVEKIETPASPPLGVKPDPFRKEQPDGNGEGKADKKRVQNRLAEIYHKH